jgi:hypothetical protein
MITDGIRCDTTVDVLPLATFDTLGYRFTYDHQLRDVCRGMFFLMDDFFG